MTVIITGSAAGATSLKLSDLTDVLIANPSDGQYLRYNGSIAVWENKFLNQDVFNYLSTAITGTNGITVTTDSVLLTYTVGLSSTGITEGDYNNVTVDSFGRVTAGTNITYLTGNETISLNGDVVGAGTTAITTAISDAIVTGKLLTGFTVGTNTAIIETDNILGAFGKVQSQINGISSVSGSFLKIDGTNSMAGNLNFSGANTRIIAPDNITFQSSSINGPTGVSVIPNGTGTVSTLQIFNNSDSTNSSFGAVVVDTDSVALISGFLGTGIQLPIKFSMNGTEKMTITPTGDIGIGTTTPNYSGGGYQPALTIEGGLPSIELTSNRVDSESVGVGTITYRLNTNTSGHQVLGQTWVDTQGITVGERGGRMVFATKKDAGPLTVGWALNNLQNWIPLNDNLSSLGEPSNSASVVYAVGGVITTSDEREKTPLHNLTKAELNAAKALAKEIGSFKWLDSVARKKDLARKHIGLTVQKAIEIMTNFGLDPMKYGFICYDKWEAQSGIPNQVDKDGKITIIGTKDRKAGDRYSFRTDELLLFIARGFQANQEELEANYTEIKDNQTEIKHRLSKLEKTIK